MLLLQGFHYFGTEFIVGRLVSADLHQHGRDILVGIHGGKVLEIFSGGSFLMSGGSIDIVKNHHEVVDGP